MWVHICVCICVNGDHICTCMYSVVTCVLICHVWHKCMLLYFICVLMLPRILNSYTCIHFSMCVYIISVISVGVWETVSPNIITIMCTIIAHFQGVWYWWDINVIWTEYTSIMHICFECSTLLRCVMCPFCIFMYIHVWQSRDHAWITWISDLRQIGNPLWSSS